MAKDLRTHRPWLSARFSTGDVVQEVFRSLLKDMGSFAGTTEDAFTGYLAMIVRNRLLDAIRYHEASQRDGRRTKPVSQAAESPSIEPGPSTSAHLESFSSDHAQATGVCHNDDVPEAVRAFHPPRPIIRPASIATRHGSMR